MNVVPLHLVQDPDEPEETLPYLDIVVGGNLTRALLDSGSARTTVVPPVDATIRHGGPSDGTGVFGVHGNESESRQVWTTTVQLGGRTIPDVDLDLRTGGEGKDLLGQDVLTRFSCEYRFGDQELRLDGPPLGADAHRIHLGEGGHVYLDLAWPPDGPAASAVFDTGASVTVVDTAFAQAHPELFIPTGASRGTDSSGATFETPMVRMAGPRLLGRDFAATRAALVDLEPVNRTIQRRMDLIIGWPILRQANWMIDHAGGLAALTD